MVPSALEIMRKTRNQRFQTIPMSFRVEGPEDAQITVELEAEAQYEVYLDGASTGKMETNLGGKLSFSVELGNGSAVDVKIVKC